MTKSVSVIFSGHHEDDREWIEKLLALNTLSGAERFTLLDAKEGRGVSEDRLRQIYQQHISELTSCPASHHSTT